MKLLGGPRPLPRRRWFMSSQRAWDLGSGQQQNSVTQWRGGVCVQLMLLSRIDPFLWKLRKYSFCCPAIHIKLGWIHHLGLFSLSAVPLPLSSKPWLGWEGDWAVAEEGRTDIWSDTHQPFSPGIRWNPAARFCYRRQFGFCWAN